MPLYRAMVCVEVEAENEEDAARQIENEISQSAFEGTHAIWLVEEE